MEQGQGLIERLLATKTEYKMHRCFGGLVGTATDETRETPVNPDGPEAAAALADKDRENARLREVLWRTVSRFGMLAELLPDQQAKTALLWRDEVSAALQEPQQKGS